MSFIAVLLVLAFGMIYYMKATQAVVPPHSAPSATIETVGVEQDLIAIANAERRYSASNGSYVSLDKLLASGELSMPRTSRGPYSYSVDTDGQTFTVRAHADRPIPNAPSSVSIDDKMAIEHD